MVLQALSPEEPPRGLSALAELRQALASSSPRAAPADCIASGVEPLDAALCGGLPAGRLVELCGSAGRMTLALSLVASALGRGACAFLDAVDGLDVEVAEHVGVDLARLLWARVGTAEDALRGADLLLRAGGFALLVLYLCGARPPRLGPGTWPRLVQRAQQEGTALLVVSDEPISGSAACATLRCEGLRGRWLPAPGGRWLLRGQEATLSELRSSLEPPPPTTLVLTR